MIGEGNFRFNVELLLSHYDKFTKDEYYSAFVEMTERYLNEMVNTMSLENAIIEKFGEERGNEIIEEAFASNPCIEDLDDTNLKEFDSAERIRNLMSYIDFDLGNINLERDDDDQDDE